MTEPNYDTPGISVVMGVYNTADKDILTQAILSILGQTEQDIEFIIYDDGSVNSVKKYLDEMAAGDARVQVIHSEDNHGLGFALNQCITQARGRYIARMDADDVCAPDRLSRQVEFLEHHPEYDWCGTNAYLFDGDGVWGMREMPGMPADRDYLKYSPFIHPSVMYRADTFRHNGGYKTIKETQRCEDYEIFMRLHKNGFRGANLQEPLMYYRENRVSYEKRTLKTRLNEAKIRSRGFKDLDVAIPIRCIYVARPLVASVIPNAFIRWWKRKESSNKRYGQHRGKTKQVYRYNSKVSAAQIFDK